MEQQKIIDEINYFRAQTITRALCGLITENT